MEKRGIRAITRFRTKTAGAMAITGIMTGVTAKRATHRIIPDRITPETKTATGTIAVGIICHGTVIKTGTFNRTMAGIIKAAIGTIPGTITGIVMMLGMTAGIMNVQTAIMIMEMTGRNAVMAMTMKTILPERTAVEMTARR